MTEREEFEKWAEKDLAISTYTNGSYCDRETSAAWEAWQAARRWIFVRERLPEKNVPVLGKYKNFFPFVVVHDGEVWRDEDFDEVLITHWQYLPPPPKETE